LAKAEEAKVPKSQSLGARARLNSRGESLRVDAKIGCLRRDRLAGGAPETLRGVHQLLDCELPVSGITLS
jgi:hypothetical protein